MSPRFLTWACVLATVAAFAVVGSILIGLGAGPMPSAGSDVAVHQGCSAALAEPYQRKSPSVSPSRNTARAYRSATGRLLRFWRHSRSISRSEPA